MMDCLNLDGCEDVEDPHKEGAKGERQPSGKVDELQDVDLTGIIFVEDEGNERQNAMDVDLKAILSVEPDYDPSNKERDGAWKHATVKFGRVKLGEPEFMVDNSDLEQQDLKLKPRHARLQKMTYASRMNVEITVQVYILDKSDKAKTGNHMHVYRRDIMKETEQVNIGLLPVMVKSNLCWLHKLQESDCHFDSCGYLLIKGTEKVFIAEEQRFLSRIWITDHPSWDASYLSQIKREKINIKLVPSKTSESCKVVNIYFMGMIMPIWVVFFALGVSSDKEAFDMIDIDRDASIINIISSTIKESHEEFEGFRTPGRARQYADELIRKSKFPPKESFDEYVCRYMFPSVNGVRSKALFLGYMVKCLLMAYSGNRKCDNKDDFRNKRLDLACQLLRRELWTHVKRAKWCMVKLMQRDLSNDGNFQDLRHYVDASIISNGLNRVFSTGSWCHPYKKGKCSGVVATLRRTNPLQTMSDLRKVRQWFAYSGTVGDARYPNPSYWGKLCFLSTPDGEKCGFVKNLAVTAVVSSVVRKPLINTFVSCGMKRLDGISLQDISGKDRIFLNGSLLGLCADPHELTLCLRSLRRTKLIDPQVEIKRDKHHKEVRVFSDPGKILRPLLVVEDLRRITRPKDGLYSFQELIDQNIVELIGVEEEEDIQCASGIRHLFSGEKEDWWSSGYTHCELDPSFLLGLSCSLIPFANHDNARSVLMQAEKISQQAIGYSPTNSEPPTNSHTRLDTLSHQMFYPQRPLFKTVVSYGLGKAETAYSFGRKDDFNTPEYFNGQNAIVSVNVHQGFNQEDSLVLNGSSLERGLFCTLHFKSYKSQVENKGITRRLKHRESINFGKVESKRGKVDSLDNEGLPYVGASLQSGDIVIGKVSESGEDHSTKLMHTEKGRVDKVVLSANDDGVNFATVTLRQSCSPCIGDKFASMHRQKGVVVLLDSQENFPFTCQGIVPDIVIKPHGFPTRQTPGQLLEAVLEKGIALGGKVRYATPFTTPTVAVITEQLHKAGFSRWGEESILNGQTGERMKSLVFMGPTFYQRLVHMAEDKVKFRNTGLVHPLTRKPVEDKKGFGGVRFGDMEWDCMIAHGAATNLHERLFTLSDFSQMHICQACERVVNVIMRPVERGSKKVHGPYCMFCCSAECIVRVNVPYGSKLLYQELFSMGICLKFDTEKVGHGCCLEDEGDEKQNAMDVDLNEILPEEDEWKGKAPCDLPSHIQMDFNVAVLQKFCKEASRSIYSATGLHDKVAWGPLPFADARQSNLVKKQKFGKDTCCFQHLRGGRSFDLGKRKHGIRKFKKTFTQSLKSFKNTDHGKFPRYWTYERLIPVKPPLQRDGSCTILSLCIALELRYFVEQKKKQRHDKIKVDMTWVKKICKQAEVYSMSEGSVPSKVLDTIIKMGGIITRKQNGSRRTIPVKSYEDKSMERMSPSDAIYEIYVYGPFIGGLLIDKDYESGPEKVYKGCLMPLDGVYHSVLCYGYQWIREQLYLEVLDNIDCKAGPYRLILFEAFDAFAFPYV